MTTHHADHADHADVLVIGSGIAGLSVALRLASRARVTLVTKETLHESNTFYAQGGIAAVLYDDDAVASHIEDTMRAGAGLCDRLAVATLCAEGPERVRELIALGVPFDKNADGTLARGREAAHAHARVVHAGGDATGQKVELQLAKLARESDIEIIEHAQLAELMTSHGKVCGARFLQKNNNAFVISSSSVVLATGGAGRLYAHTTNPSIATGDGVAAAFLAGAQISDAEMFQFHPTLLATGVPTLVTEALRGEGAVLRNRAGKRFMPWYHPDAELAPRDVVARAITDEMAQQDDEPVLLDATALEPRLLKQHFPTVDAACTAAGIDFTREAIPVTPAAHFWMGGVTTDMFGRTTLPGLYAVGEVACTFVHGANRLASNSLLEGLVFAKRVADCIGNQMSSDDSLVMDSSFITHETTPSLCTITLSSDSRATLRVQQHMHVTQSEIAKLMWENVGLARDAHGIRVAEKQLAAWIDDAVEARMSSTHALSIANLILCARLVALGAITREESRGAHKRDDFLESDPAWERHIGIVCTNNSQGTRFSSYETTEQLCS